jgi:cation diffusion facilitator CzcD-associated flavoprotein CzcO
MAAHTAVILGGGIDGIVAAHRLRRELDASDRVVARSAIRAAIAA